MKRRTGAAAAPAQGRAAYGVWAALAAAAVLSFVLVAPAHAGKNKNGALIVHTNDSYLFSAQTVCSATLGDPGTCSAAITRSDKSSGTVVWLLASFLSTASPGVAGIYFGIEYDDLVLDPGVAFKACGPAGTLELPDGDWPYSGRGNTVAFGTPIVGDTLFPFYVFRIDGGAPGAFFGTAVNALAGYAAFIDDSAPPVTDRCSRFGQVHWYEQGSNNCPAPSTCAITVTSPTTAVSWTQGTLHEITWNSSQCGATIAIEILLNDVVCAVIAAEAPNNGSYGWVAQQCNGASAGYKIRITDLDAGNSDDSDATFSIPSLGCQIAVASPNGGEHLSTGSPLEISWGSTSCGSTVKIELVKNGSVCLTISDATANTGSFSWTVEPCGVEECGYKIRVTDAVSSHADESDGVFCIRPCTVEVAAPNGGERWSPGTAQTITWNSSGCGENVKVELLQNGAPCATISEQTVNDGSIPWTAQPCNGTSGYRIRVTDIDSGLHDDSDADFCIGCDDVFSVPGGVEFTIGQDTAEVLIQGKNAQGLKGYSVRLCFDSAVFECLDLTLDETRGLGAASLQKSCSEGCAEAAVSYSPSCPPQIAPGDGAILKVVFRVKPDAPLGPTSIDLADSQGGVNRLTPCDAPAFAPLLVDGTIEILPERFRRGDDNGDGATNIADPLYCLAHQYGGGPAPPCMDAGDFDDSGRYDLSDCIANLCRQFAGCADPPPPYGTCGPDNTNQDPLDCGSFPPCGTFAVRPTGRFAGSGMSAASHLRCTPALSGDLLRIVVEASTEEPAIGLQFDMHFDPSVLRFRRVERDPLAVDYFSARPSPTAGSIRVGFVADLEMQIPLAGTRALGEIFFDILAPARIEGARIAIADALHVTADLRVLPASGEELIVAPDPTLGAHPADYGLTLPNPLPAHAAILVWVARALPVRLDIYSIQGRRLRTLFDGDLPRGDHPILWDGMTEDGAEAASGIYCLSARIGAERIDRKFVRVR